jgi:ABC-2 type transport system ATP-binding protein
MADLPANVIEVSSNNIRQLKQQLITLPEVISASQLGAHLRVLINKTIANPIDFLTESHSFSSTAAMHIVRPSLEDVFVLSTGHNITSQSSLQSEMQQDIHKVIS